VIQRVGGPALTLVDSAATTAAAVALTLAASGLARGAVNGRARRHLMATDGRERFARVGRHFLGEAMTADDVELVDL